MAHTNLDLANALADAKSQYTAANPRSHELHRKACGPLPGGNTRTTLHYDPFPVVIEQGEGSVVTDVDGHDYADFIGEYTAGLYGHSHPGIKAAIEKVLKRGLSLCSPTAAEAQLAAILCQRFPSVEQIRFTNSGTEANLMIAGAARHFTGRDALMVFNGGYHGGVFYFATGASPINAPYPFVLGEFNDPDTTLRRLEENANRLAALFIEPVMGTSGALPVNLDFLKALRTRTEELGILLVFDEVMTSRLSPGGAQQLFGITPDMSSFGKYIGGGLTFGAFGGRADVMAQFDPRRSDSLPHAGTFNNNVLTMAAGLAGMRDIYTPAVAIAHNARGDAYRERLNSIIEALDVPAQVTGAGSMLGFHFTREVINTPHDARRTPADARALFHLAMLNRGFYLGRAGLASLSLPLEQRHYDDFAEAFREFLTVYANVLRGM